MRADAFHTLCKPPANPCNRMQHYKGKSHRDPLESDTGTFKTFKAHGHCLVHMRENRFSLQLRIFLALLANQQRDYCRNRCIFKNRNTIALELPGFICSINKTEEVRQRQCQQRQLLATLSLNMFLWHDFLALIVSVFATTVQYSSTSRTTAYYFCMCSNHMKAQKMRKTTNITITITILVIMM